MSRPKMLDLFCCQGGAGMGYHRAGFDVVGVDISPQPRYPFEFVQADALEYVAEHWHDFDAIHASPPCQFYSATKNAQGARSDHPDLVGPTRATLQATDLPYVIENVEGAPLINPLRLCGTEFGLRAADIDGVELQLQRHRLFEANFFLVGAGGCSHLSTIPVAGVYGGSRHTKPEHRDDSARRGGYTPRGKVAAALLGIDWMTQHGLAQAIPPAYTEFIGGQLLDHLMKEAA